MDKLIACALAFEKLLDVQYRMIVGRKGKAVELLVGFSMLDFHHLMGLGNLKDLRLATMNRETVFQKILSGNFSYEVIAKSRYIHLIENRFHPLVHIEQLFDDNRLVFRYNQKQNQFSLIKADYLLTSPYEQNDVYIFLARRKESDRYFCRSFFPKEQRDYTKGQAVYTLLYKEKICLSTKDIHIQYDRLTPKK
ncbi:MAG: PBECR4 domain-containing protein [Butyrivibrio sp.]|nr:PBECR4 domain-containing protein [Butyrivibrio sp.]